MAKIKGQGVNLGIAQEGTRGTFTTPTDWMLARTPTGITVTEERTQIEETNASGVDTSGSVITQKSAEGDLEFNVRANSIGHLLKSLWGKVNTSTVETGVYKHVFSVLADDPQKPALSLGLAQDNGGQDYEYTTALVSSLELKTPVDDLVNATASFVATKEATHSGNFTPAFASNDYFFTQEEVAVKLASSLSGLDSANAIKLKEFSTTQEANTSKNQTIGNLNLDDVLAGRMAITGSFMADYDGTTYHDIYEQGSYKAMRLEITSGKTIGATSNPKITIDLARVSFESYEADRPLDDIIHDNVEFKAHYDASEAKVGNVTVINETASY